MTITFEPLHESHFPLLLKWLKTPHVKKWWDQDVTYTLELVKEKFGKHTHGIALSKNSNHKTYAYIISMDKEMIGYIQAYNAHDFAQENGLNLSVISGSVCGVDLFIGVQQFLYQGWGARILNEFQELILAPHFDWCLIDPAKDNLTAIKSFTKAGFKIFEQFQTESNIWMNKKINRDDLPKVGLGVLVFNFDNQILLGKRKNSHGASSWGPPGGHLEFGEGLGECAIREVLEETGLVIKKPKFLAITNDIFKEEGKHYVSIFMHAHLSDGQIVQNLEPHKVEDRKSVV